MCWGGERATGTLETGEQQGAFRNAFLSAFGKKKNNTKSQQHSSVSIQQCASFNIALLLNKHCRYFKKLSQEARAEKLKSLVFTDFSWLSMSYRKQ